MNGGESYINDLLRRILFLPTQASSVAAEIDHLHFLVISCTMVGAAALTVVGLYFVVRYRLGHRQLQREDPDARPSLRTEVVVIAGLLGLFCLFWFIGFRQYVRLAAVPADSIDVYVTGKQWMWKFAYPDGRHSVSVLYVPIDRPVRLLLTSRDVIHSFYVPEFRTKQDAVPGRYTTMWFQAVRPGRYWILCTEYCGMGHSTMRGQVIALRPEDYARWKAGAQIEADVPVPRQVAGAPRGNLAGAWNISGPRTESALSVEEYAPVEDLDLVAMGERVAAREGCLRCHTLDGSRYIGPSWAGLFLSTIPLEGGGQVLADPAYLTESMMDPMAKIHAGYAPVMPSYMGLLSPAEVSALVELMRALSGLRPESAEPQVPDAPLPAGSIVPQAPPARDPRP